MLAVSAGGVVGAEARLGVTQLMPRAAGEVPWATLIINVSGCFLVGALVAVILASNANPLLRPFLVVGVLGGYTTFSAYTVDFVILVNAGRVPAGVTYVVGTFVLGVAAVVLGGRLASRVLGRTGISPQVDPGGDV